MFSDRFLLGSHLSTDKIRRHYTSELGIMRAHSEARDKEEYSPSFLDEVRQRNRLDRLKRACRDELESDWLMEAGPTVDPVYLEPIHPDILAEDADPLSYGMFIRDVTIQKTTNQTAIIFYSTLYLKTLFTLKNTTTISDEPIFRPEISIGNCEK